MDTNSTERAISDAFKAAQRYVDRLQPLGRTIPVDKDAKFEMSLPKWFDEERFRRATLRNRTNVHASIIGTTVGLLSILSIPTILNVLRHTKQSDTAQLSYRRYVATMQYSMSWMTGELKPGSSAWKSLEVIRKRHVLISRNTERAETGIISQTDMAMVQFAVVGFPINNPKLFGYIATPQHVDDVMYMWRVLGHMLGIREEYNLFCESGPENLARLALVQEQIFRPCMSAAVSEPEFRRLAGTMVTGVSAFNPMLSTESFLYFSRMVNGCAGYVGYWDGTDGGKLAAMGWWDRWLLWQQMVVHRYLVRWPVTRFALTVWSIGLFMMVTYAPVLAVWRFGWRRGFVRVMKHRK